MSTNPYEPPKEVGTPSRNVLWLMAGIVVVTLLLWLPITGVFANAIQWPLLHVGIDSATAQAIWWNRTMFCFGISLPCAIAISAATVFICTRRTKRPI